MKAQETADALLGMSTATKQTEYEYMLYFESHVVLFTFVRPDELHNHTQVQAK